MTDCLFCKMVAGVIKPDTVYEDQDILAFKDIHPRAPLHVLVVPKIHIPTLNELKPEHAELVGKLFLAAHAIAKQHGYAEMGYRTVHGLATVSQLAPAGVRSEESQPWNYPHAHYSGCC
jgi:histidine triad (HIT) family protein